MGVCFDVSIVYFRCDTFSVRKTKERNVLSSRKMKCKFEILGYIQYTCYTVNSLITGHSKRRTPPFSGQIPLHRQNHGQNLTQNFLNSGQSISGHSD